MKKALSVLFFSVFTLVQAHAVEPTLKAQAQARINDSIGAHLQVREVEALANRQLFEVSLEDGGVIHMTPDFNFFLYGDSLYELTNSGAVNVTEARLNPKRAAIMKTVKDEDTVKFAAKGKEKTVIDVFTDIECPYCQKLHNEVPRLNELGITVRYLAYPRAGVLDMRTGQPTTSYKKINYVWCASDRTHQMTRIKNAQHDLGVLSQQIRQGAGSAVEKKYKKVEAELAEAMKKSTCKSPVEDQMSLVQQLGISGTPAIITKEGVLHPGYMPADELARRLGVL